MKKKLLLLLLTVTCMTFTVNAQNLVSNPGFEAGDASNFTNWSKYGNPNSNLTVETTQVHSGARALKAVAEGAPGNQYVVQLHSDNVTTVSGQNYEVTLWAKAATAGNTLRISTSGGTAVYGPDTAIGTAWQLVTFQFTASASATALNLDLGGSTQTFYIDDVNMHVNPNLLLNGGLEMKGAGSDAFANWSLYGTAANMTKETVEVHNGGAALKAISAGAPSAQYTVQFHSDNVTTVNGQKYELNYWIKAATAGNTMRVSTSGGTAVYGADIAIGTSWTKKTFTFTASATSTAINFDLGGSSQTFYIDDIEMHAVTNLLTNGTFEALGGQGQYTNDGTADNVFTGWAAYNGGAAMTQTTVATEVHSGNSALKTISKGSAEYNVQLHQNLTLVVGTAYELRFWIKSSDNLAGTMRVSIDGASGQYSPNFSVTTAWQQVSYSFTANATSSGLNFDLGKSTRTFFIDDAELYAINNNKVLNGTFETLSSGGNQGTYTDNDTANGGTGIATNNIFLGWSAYNGGDGMTVETTDVHGGTQALHAVSRGTGGNGDRWKTQLHSNNVTTIVGKSYEVACWIKTVSGTAQMRLSTAGTAVYGNDTSITTTWQRVSKTLTASATTLALNLDLGGSNPANFIVDDVEINAAGCSPTTSEQSVSACGSYTYYGTTYTASGEYSYSDGCNTDYLHLTIVPLTTSEVTVTHHGASYDYYGATLTASGDYTHVTGCNTETLHLTLITTEIPTSFDLCTGATVATATAGTSLKIYKAETGGTALLGATKLVAGTVWVTETPTSGPNAGIESTPRVSRTVSLTALVPAPAVSSLDSKLICKYIGTSNPVTFTATGTATSYAWTVNNGAAIVGDATGSSIAVSFLNASPTVAGTQYTVTVDSKNALGCPSGKPKALVLTTKAPSAPKSIVLTYGATVIKKAGNFVGDASKTLTLTATDISNSADHHVWTLPAGTNVVTGNPNADLVLTVNLGGVAAANTDLLFTCASVGGCASTSKTLIVKRAEAGKPKALVLTDETAAPGVAIKKLDSYTGTLKNTPLTLTVTPNVSQGSEATSYKWVLPVGIHVVSGASAGATSGGFTTYTGTATSLIVDLSTVSNETSFLMSVFGVNGNGQSLLSKDLTCTSAAPKAPSALYAGTSGSGTTFVAYNPSCGVVNVSVPAVTGVSYSFEVVSGGATVLGVTNNSAAINLSGAGDLTTSTVVIKVTSSTATGSNFKLFTVKHASACSGSRSISDEVVADEFNVVAYPNPSSDVFNIEVQSSGKGASTGVQVYDMAGRLIEQRQVQSNSVEVGSKYASGVYNVIVNQGSKVKTLRVIKR